MLTGTRQSRVRSSENQPVLQLQILPEHNNKFQEIYICIAEPIGALKKITVRGGRQIVSTVTHCICDCAPIIEETIRGFRQERATHLAITDSGSQIQDENESKFLYFLKPFIFMKNKVFELVDIICQIIEYLFSEEARTEENNQDSARMLDGSGYICCLIRDRNIQCPTNLNTFESQMIKATQNLLKYSFAKNKASKIGIQNAIYGFEMSQKVQQYLQNKDYVSLLNLCKKLMLDLKFDAFVQSLMQDLGILKNNRVAFYVLQSILSPIVKLDPNSDVSEQIGNTFIILARIAEIKSGRAIPRI